MGFSLNHNECTVIDVGGQRNERQKWIHCFENVDLLIFVANLDGYNQFLYEDNDTNRLTEDLELFDQIVNSKRFRDTRMVLLLNCKDIFRVKIEAIKGRRREEAFFRFHQPRLKDALTMSEDGEVRACLHDILPQELLSIVESYCSQPRYPLKALFADYTAHQTYSTALHYIQSQFV